MYLNHKFDEPVVVLINFEAIFILKLLLNDMEYFVINNLRFRIKPLKNNFPFIKKKVCFGKVAKSWVTSEIQFFYYQKKNYVTNKKNIWSWNTKRLLTKIFILLVFRTFKKTVGYGNSKTQQGVSLKTLTLELQFLFRTIV